MKLIISSILVLIGSVLLAQSPGFGIGKFQTSATFAFGMEQNQFLEGHITYRTSKMVDYRGKALINLSGEEKNHLILFGPNYHFTDLRFDPYVSLGSGLEINAKDVPPTFYGGMGFNYYFNHFFVLNADASWINPLGYSGFQSWIVHGGLSFCF